MNVTPDHLVLELGNSTCNLHLHHMEVVNKGIESVEVTLPVVLASMVINIYTAAVITAKEKSGINSLIVSDCAVNVLSLVMFVANELPASFLRSDAWCTIFTFSDSVMNNWNRLVPVGIVVYRYILVCHAVTAMSFGERKLWRIVITSLILLSLLNGGASVVPPEDHRFYMRFNIGDFYAHPGPSGLVICGPWWSPQRVFVNVIQWSFFLFVPLLYGTIYSFRRTHTVTNIGISESERKRRKESNLFSTKINFTAWAIEMFGSAIFLVPSPLSIEQRSFIHHTITNTCPPLFYAAAAQKEKLKDMKIKLMGPGNRVKPS